MTIANLIRFVCLNNMPIAEIHLWYLYAIIYVLVIVGFCRKRKWDKYLYMSVPILFAVNIILNELLNLFGIRNIPGTLGGNFLVTGIPFFGTGMMIYQKRENIQNNSLKKNVILMLIFAVIFHLEYLLLRYKDVGTTSCAMKIPLTIMVFILFEFNFNKENAVLNAMATIGRKYSLHIYIFHEFIMKLFQSAPFEIPFLYSDLRPVVIYVPTLILSIILVEAGSVIKQRMSKGKGNKGE